MVIRVGCVDDGVSCIRRAAVDGVWVYCNLPNSVRTSM